MSASERAIAYASTETPTRPLRPLVLFVLLPLLAVAAVIMSSPADAVSFPPGYVKVNTNSTVGMRAYEGRLTSTRATAGNCNRGYVNVYPGSRTSASFDADCVRAYWGSSKVTGVVKVYSNTPYWHQVAYVNIGCTSNRVDVAVHGGETAYVNYARRC